MSATPPLRPRRFSARAALAGAATGLVVSPLLAFLGVALARGDLGYAANVLALLLVAGSVVGTVVAALVAVIVAATQGTSARRGFALGFALGWAVFVVVGAGPCVDMVGGLVTGTSGRS